MSFALAEVDAFLRDKFPIRERLLSSWMDRLAAGEGEPMRIRSGSRPVLGTVFERLIGLDLTSTVVYEQDLARVPQAVSEPILGRAGFSLIGQLGEARWARATSYEMPEPSLPWLEDWWQLVHVQTALWTNEPKTEFDRQVLWDMVAPYVSPADLREEGAAALLVLWGRYRPAGRSSLRQLGTPVQAQVVLDDPVTADLVCGRCLVDVKVYADPGLEDANEWLEQLLQYVITDYDDRHGFDRVAIYAGWQAVLLEEPLGALLAKVSGRDDVDLRTLRREFRPIGENYAAEAYRARHNRPRPRTHY